MAVDTFHTLKMSSGQRSERLILFFILSWKPMFNIKKICGGFHSIHVSFMGEKGVLIFVAKE